jgi:adenylate cyclase
VLCGLGAFGAAALVSVTKPAQQLEHVCLDRAYELLGAPSEPPDGVVLLLIDPPSLLGVRYLFPDRENAWPWRRLLYGAVADFLHHAGARAVAFDLDLSGPSVYDLEGDSEPAARAMAGGKVYLGVNFTALEERLGAGEAVGAARLEALLEEERRALAEHAVEASEDGRLPLEQVEGGIPVARVPFGPLSERAVARLGAVNARIDAGGALRRVPLLVRHQGKLFPSLALAVYLDLLGIEKVAVTEEGRLALDGLSVPLDAAGSYLVNWYGPEQTFPSFSIYQTIRIALADYERRCPEEPPEACPEPLYWNWCGFAKDYSTAEIEAHRRLFRDKVVFVGANASELGGQGRDVWNNPFSSAFPGVEVHATVLANLLERRMLERAGPAARLATLLGIALLLGAGAPLVGGEKRGLLLFFVVLGGYSLLFRHLFLHHLIWIDLAGPFFAATLAYGGSALAAYFISGRLRRQLRRTFDRVLQPELIDLLLREPERLALGGESRNLTVLFSDLQESSAYAEKLTAPELVANLNRYFSEFTGIVLARGGYLDKYIGDGVMAVWGAPVENTRHAASACLAALELWDRLGRLRDEHVAKHGVRLVTRMGLQSGEMVAGMVGSQGLAHYTVMGDNVVIASRLEGANKHYGTEILIGEGCYEQARGSIEAREIDLVVLKGRTRPLRIYEPLAPAGALDAKGRERLEGFAAALALYRKRCWPEAAAAFEALLGLEPEDGPARVFLERCRLFAREEPPPAWRGEFILVAK